MYTHARKLVYKLSQVTGNPCLLKMEILRYTYIFLQGCEDSDNLPSV